ncbi:unnamed protein product, partial [Ectocarpus sp. 12 AP-2014]
SGALVFLQQSWARWAAKRKLAGCHWILINGIDMVNSQAKIPWAINFERVWNWDKPDLDRQPGLCRYLETKVAQTLDVLSLVYPRTSANPSLRMKCTEDRISGSSRIRRAKKCYVVR